MKDCMRVIVCYPVILCTADFSTTTKQSLQADTEVGKLLLAIENLSHSDASAMQILLGSV